ncbi:response regulator transcription factor [Sphingosinicella rhizophila]|uniref:Response regulator n=1 Tax=Sphingosinicella rhizophila TaxID=3050082 RepID=A0ABU3Q6H7_9SPHN|nr:response regulator [Sphingosinicella sp. GR2756]MDT9599006.1 response regulator [Sphingosinicella sp. GR2756]
MMTKRMVYIVDDEEAIRRSCTLMLRVQGYEVATFESGVSLLNVLKALAPGCILLDVRMPEMDGIEVQKALNIEGSLHPVVVMTGHGDVGTAAAALREGAIAFIEKPFSKITVNRALHLAFLKLERPHDYLAHIEAAACAVASLSEEQKIVLAKLAEGKSNEAMAAEMGVDMAAVEMLRARLLSELKVESITEVLWIAFAAGVGRQAGETTSFSRDLNI